MEESFIVLMPIIILARLTWRALPSLHSHKLDVPFLLRQHIDLYFENTHGHSLDIWKIIDE